MNLYVSLVFEPQIDGSPLAQVTLQIPTLVLYRLHNQSHPTETLPGTLQRIFDQALEHELDPQLSNDE